MIARMGGSFFWGVCDGGAEGEESQLARPGGQPTGLEAYPTRNWSCFVLFAKRTWGMGSFLHLLARFAGEGSELILEGGEEIS